MRKQLQTNTLVFVLWICLAIVIHFALTCTLIHPIDVKLPVTMVEQSDSSVEAYLVKAKKAPTQARTANPVQQTPHVLSNENSVVTEKIAQEPVTSTEDAAHAITEIPQTDTQNAPLADSQQDPAPPDELLSQSNHFLENTLKHEGNFSAESEGALNRMAPATIKSPAPRYPTKAKSEGRTGRTQLRVTIDASGRPTDVGVEGSSGHLDLDERARDTVRKRWRFAPPERGRLTKTTFLVEIEFKLTA